MLPECILNDNSVIRHDNVNKWKHFPRDWPFVRGIHRSPMNSPRRGQWRGALIFPLMCAGVNGRANNCEACNLRRHRTHYDVTVMVDLMQIIYSIYRRKQCHICKTHLLCLHIDHWRFRNSVIWTIVQRRKRNKNIHWAFYMIYSFMLEIILLSYALRQGFVNIIT